jgi:hypothetical protein
MKKKLLGVEGNAIVREAFTILDMSHCSKTIFIQLTFISVMPIPSCFMLSSLDIFSSDFMESLPMASILLHHPGPLAVLTPSSKSERAHV